MNLHFSNTAQVPGLSDFGSREGSVFYSQRSVRERIHGGDISDIQNSWLIHARPSEKSQTHTVFTFYTIYVTPYVLLVLLGRSAALRRRSVAIARIPLVVP